MKYRGYLVRSLTIFFALAMSLPLEGKTIFIPRSQGDNTARELVGWQRQIFQCYDTNYAALASTVEYTRTFKKETIARSFFSTPCLTFAGSQSEDRTQNDIVADYFGLPTDFKGTLAIKPRIENIIADLNLYFGLDGWRPGFFLRVNAPITHTRWTLGLDECIARDGKFRGCTQFPACYMFSDTPAVSPANCPVIVPPKRIIPEEDPNNPVTPCPVNTFLDVPNNQRNANCTTQSIREALSGDFTFGDMVETWDFGRFSFCPRSKTGLADIDISIGYNFLHAERYHVGFSVVTVIPTGNRPKGKYIFEPLVGNGKHWQLGGGFTGHLSLFPDHLVDCFNMGFYIDGRVVHVFKTDQIRSFDFKQNGLLSRYLLLKEFNTDLNYNGTMINAINFATRNCEVHVGLQADISAKAFARAYGWEFDVGYNFFQRDPEKVCIKTECPCALDSRIFGIKGVEGVCGQQYTVQNNLAQEPVTMIEINDIQPDATMFNPILREPDPSIATPPVVLAWNSKPIDANQTVPLNELAEQGFILENIQKDQSQSQSAFISCADLNPHSAAQGRMRTHKVFGHISYTFSDGTHCPFIGIGAEGEFDSCNVNALQQWGIWIKGGATF